MYGWVTGEDSSSQKENRINQQDFGSLGPVENDALAPPVSCFPNGYPESDDNEPLKLDQKLKNYNGNCKPESRGGSVACRECGDKFTFLMNQRYSCKYCGQSFCSQHIHTTTLKSGSSIDMSSLRLCSGCRDSTLQKLRLKVRLPCTLRMGNDEERHFHRMISSNQKIDFLDAMVRCLQKRSFIN